MSPVVVFDSGAIVVEEVFGGCQGLELKGGISGDVFDDAGDGEWSFIGLI